MWDDLKAKLREAVTTAPPPLPSIIDKKLRARVMSATQKSVRFGLPDMAAQMAVDMVATAGEWRASYRLGVIAVEDVGVANAELVASTLIASVDKELRAEIGPDRLAAHLADRMARSVKSRLVCDLSIAADPKWIGTMTGDLTETEQIANSLSRKSWGGGWFALACAIVAHDPPTIKERQPDLTMIDGWLAASMDMHEGTGIRSLLYFAKASKDVRRFLEQHEVSNRLLCVGNAVFDAESAVCDRMLTSKLIREAAHASTRTYAADVGLTLEQHHELVQIVAAESAVLHRSRERILRAIAEEEAAKAMQRDLPLQPPSGGAP